jgi:hypothetical protein
MMRSVPWDELPGGIARKKKSDPIAIEKIIIVEENQPRNYQHEVKEIGKRFLFGALVI